MLDSFSNWSIPLYGEISNQIWLGFFMKEVSTWLFPGWQIHLYIPTFWKNIKPHESEYLIKHIY